MSTCKCFHPCAAAVVIVIGAIAAAGCHPTGSSVAVWICDDSRHQGRRAFDKSAPSDVPRTANRIELAGAINETLSFHFALRPRASTIEQPDLLAAPFSSGATRIDPSVVTLYRMQPVPVGEFPGWHIRSLPPNERDSEPLDVLVPVRAPRGGLPAKLLAGETYHFWADVAIPKGTGEGTYTTEIELRSRGKPVCALALHLTVWPFVLPDEADPPVIAELDHRALLCHHVEYRGRPHVLSVDDWRQDPMQGELDSLLMATLRMLQSHRLTPVLHKLTPLVKVLATGEVAIDWGQYDAVVEPCLSGKAFFNRVGLSLWPLPFHEVFPVSRPDAARESPRHAELLREYVVRCVQHFEQKGWLDRSYALPPTVTGSRTELVETARQFAASVRMADPRIAIVSRLFPQDLAPYGWVDYPHIDFADCVDIWMPPAQFYDAQVMAAERAAGRRTWVTVDRPPFSGAVTASAASTHVRVLTWQARQLGATGLSVGCINRWPDAQKSPTPNDCIRYDPSALLYPGRPFGLLEPVPSVRLKWLRRSVQDAAYRALLERHGLEHVTSTLRRSLAPYAASDAYRTHFADGRPIGWVDDPALFEAARHIMAEALVTASYPQTDKTRSELFARSAAWRRFMGEARKVRFYVDGTRVRMSGTQTTMAAEVECSLTIANGRRAPMAGTVRFLELPEGWTAQNDGEPVGPIAPNGSRRVTLVAHATVMPIQAGGSFALPLEFVEDAGATSQSMNRQADEPVRHRVDARVCYVAAEPRTRPIVIDGDLSDWPPGSTNVAADFVLITGAPADPDRAWVTRPHRQTMTFLMRDAEYLYLAVNCETDAEPATPTVRRKAVVYDDLIPVGEELIEVLIDPFNTGTRSPSDLYHIVVKRAGSDLTEKGVHFEPPCGTHEPWAVEIDVATSTLKGRWTAELAIPLAAFGPLATDHTTWGFSVTRYDALRQEFSTWSGAARNAYDPLSLGNLYLP